MKILVRILVVFVALVLLIAGIGFLLPRQVHVERSVVVQAPQARVFALVNSFQRFNEWSPWAQRDPNTKYVYEGPAAGVGSKMTWTSDHPNVGNGAQWIVESDAPRWVKSELDFGAQGTAFATFTLKQEGEGVHVTWGLDSDMGNNPVGRYFGLAMDGMIGPDYEQGLAGLKKLAEAEPPQEVADDSEPESADGSQADAPEPG